MNLNGIYLFWYLSVNPPPPPPLSPPSHDFCCRLSHLLMLYIAKNMNQDETASKGEQSDQDS